MFFAVSGFLVSRSLDRRTLRDFALNRVGRIFPGLAFVTVTTALLLGPVVTAYEASAYFNSAETYRYFGNIACHVRYVLPGVFVGHPDDRIVNVSLWSIPWEVGCYITLAGLCAVGLWSRRWLITLVAVVVICMPFLSFMLHMSEPSMLEGSPRLARLLDFLNDWEARTIAYFASGVLISRFAHRIPHGMGWALAAAAAVTVLTLLTTEEDDGWAVSISAPLLAYIAIFIGCSNFHVPGSPKSDLSYGIYLFGYPIQQTIYGMSQGTAPPLNFIMSLPFVFLAAFLSWHLIERPALSIIARARSRAA